MLRNHRKTVIRFDVFNYQQQPAASENGKDKLHVNGQLNYNDLGNQNRNKIEIHKSIKPKMEIPCNNIVNIVMSGMAFIVPHIQAKNRHHPPPLTIPYVFIPIWIWYLLLSSSSPMGVLLNDLLHIGSRFLINRSPGSERMEPFSTFSEMEMMSFWFLRKLKIWFQALNMCSKIVMNRLLIVCRYPTPCCFVPLNWSILQLQYSNEDWPSNVCMQIQNLSSCFCFFDGLLPISFFYLFRSRDDMEGLREPRGRTRWNDIIILKW